MSGVMIVTGTDTDIGKSVAAAGIAAVLGTHYWKPIQAGMSGGTDSDTVEALGVDSDHALPEAYRLDLPASPHLAAERQGLAIEDDRLILPDIRPLVVEGAGGLMVPIRRDPAWLMIDQMARWNHPVLLVARTGLGTINHSLLSIEAMRARSMAIAGILFVGDAHDDNERTVPALGQVRSFGRLPLLDPLDGANLRAAMAAHVDLKGIREAMGLAA